jgi:hypothetical protein
MVQAQLAQFSSVRERTLNMVQRLSQEQMDFSPTAGEWSVGEVVDHLLLAEDMYRVEIATLIELTQTDRAPRIYRSFTDLNAGPSIIPKSLLPFFEVPFALLTMFTPRSIRECVARSQLVPIRHPDSTTPRPGRSADQLRHALGASLAETKALFAAHPNLDYTAMTYQHPLLGVQNVPQLLEFMGLHEELHQQQLSNALANSRFPKAA